MAVLLSAGLLRAQGSGSGSGSGSSLTVTPSATALTFAWAEGASLPAAQSVSLRLSSGTATYTAAITPSASDPTSGAWLIATPDSGTLPGSISVRVDPDTMAPGTYTATVVVTVTGVSNPVNIGVTLSVSLPAGGATVIPTAVTLTSPGTLTGTFSIDAGPAPLTFTAASGTTWLTVSPLAGAVLPSGSTTITVTANAAALTPQTTAYTAKVTLVISCGATAKSQTVTVNLTVNAVTPTITSVWPSSIPVGSPDTTVAIRGTNFFSGTTITTSGSSTALKSTLVSGDVMEAVLPTALLASAGTISLIATNPAPAAASQPFQISVGSGPAIGSVLNAASFASGGISPGEMITIFGANLGPSTPVGMTQTVNPGFADTNVGGITVSIDSQDAPIIYGSATEVNVQVPYEVSIGTGKTLEITYGNSAPADFTVDTVAAAPGIFTLNGVGSGQAVAMNYDSTTSTYTVNSKTTPVYIGQTLIFFLTGEGDYASAAFPIETGLIVPTTPPNGGYPQLSPLPTVTIGGATADTSTMYAGPIGGCILGLLEIDAVVPAAATTGVAVPLSVTIGSGNSAVTTQANVTVSVHP